MRRAYFCSDPKEGPVLVTSFSDGLSTSRLDLDDTITAEGNVAPMACGPHQKRAPPPGRCGWTPVALEKWRYLEYLNRAIPSTSLILAKEPSGCIFYSTCYCLYYYFSRLSHGCRWSLFFFCYKQYMANLQTEVTSSAPAPAQSSTPAPVHHPQMMARSCALPQVVQAGTSPRSQLLPSNFQLLGASRGDVLGAGCPLVFSLGFKATPVEESVPYRFPLLSSQPSGQRNICYLVTDPCGGHSGILPAELAILPETLL